MAEHTPGPWEAKYYNGFEWEVIKADPSKPHWPWYIATCCAAAAGGSTEANALLIAASTELLDACRAALPVLREACAAGLLPADDPSDRIALDRVEAAIARATGGA